MHGIIQRHPPKNLCGERSPETPAMKQHFVCWVLSVGEVLPSATHLLNSGIGLLGLFGTSGDLSRFITWDKFSCMHSLTCFPWRTFEAEGYVGWAPTSALHHGHPLADLLVQHLEPGNGGDLIIPVSTRAMKIIWEGRTRQSKHPLCSQEMLGWGGFQRLLVYLILKRVLFLSSASNGRDCLWAVNQQPQEEVSKCQAPLLTFLLTPSLQRALPWVLERAGLGSLNKAQRRCWTETSQQDFYPQLEFLSSTLVSHMGSTEN